MKTAKTLSAALRLERRKNRRLRKVIDDLHAAVLKNSHDLDVQFNRLSQLQAEVDLLKSRSRD
jgi:hypothetical protein